MSIGRRLFNLARGELNALMDRIGDREGIPDTSSVDPNEDLYRRYALGEFSDDELEAELERRLRTRRQSAAPSSPNPSRPASAPPKPSASRPSSPPQPKPSASRPSTPPPPKSTPATPRVSESVRLAYAALELPVGAEFAEVRKAYRALMRKYHPDKHTSTPEKQKAATELAQKLSQAYAILEQHLRG